MEAVVTLQDVPQVSREKVLRLEAALRSLPNQIDPEAGVTHHFAPGVYVRELFIPAGACIVGKIHRHEHLSILMKGSIVVLTETGPVEMHAPSIVKAPPGTKRAAYALTDVIWVNVHPNPDDEPDLTILESRYIAPSFDALTSQPALENHS
jgi:quercetin dioxygenase-like cupin family protein